MKPTDGYYSDLLLASLLRLGLFLGILSIIAVVSSGCSRDENRDVSPFGKLAARDPLDLGEAAQTRNRLPQGGCDEKSDSSLTGPTGRVP
jgi:hypothetical protein